VLAKRLRNSGALVDSWVIVLVLGLIGAYAFVRLALRYYFPPAGYLMQRRQRPRPRRWVRRLPDLASFLRSMT
jgi:hypothetical protein